MIAEDRADDAARGPDGGREERGTLPPPPPPAPRGPAQPPGEVNGPPGPEPTRYGDWEKGGRCSDF